MEPLGAFLPNLLGGLRNTMLITLSAFPLAAAIAFLVAIVRVWRVPILAVALQVCVDFIRSVPLVMQLFFVFFALPFVGVAIPPFPACILTFAVHYGAYMSESVRGAILSVDRAQWESAIVLNMSRVESARLVILPQALRIVVPIFANDLIDMFKTSSLAALVSVPELTFVGRVEVLASFQTVLIYSVVAAIYFVVSFPASILARRLERSVALV